MEKLEKILHAEDSARTAVDESRAAGVLALSEARAKAAEVLRSGREEICAAAAVKRETVLEQARAEVAEASTRAAEEARLALADAEVRADEALAAVLQVLKGR